MAQRSPAPIYLTVDEFETYDVPEEFFAELVRGELVLTPSPRAASIVRARRATGRSGASTFRGAPTEFGARRK